MGLKRVLLLSMGLLAAVQSVFAAESQFGFVYTTDLLPKGEKEIEQWITLREQKNHGTFHQIDGRTEIEYGQSDDFQLAVYLNYSWTDAYKNGPDGATTAPEPFSSLNPPDPNKRYQASLFTGLAVEGLWRLMSPYTDPLGLALYVEPVWGPNFFEVESRAILQKNYLDDTLVFAFNFTYAPEFRKNPGESTWNTEADTNYTFGASYRFASNWSGGFEFLNEQEYQSFLESKRISSDAWFFGPSFHYGGKRFFATVVVLAQMPWANRFPDSQPGAISGGYNGDVDFERYRVRAKLGWLF